MQKIVNRLSMLRMTHRDLATALSPSRNVENRSREQILHPVALQCSEQNLGRQLILELD